MLDIDPTFKDLHFNMNLQYFAGPNYLELRVMVPMKQWLRTDEAQISPRGDILLGASYSCLLAGYRFGRDDSLGEDLGCCCG